MMIQLLKIEGDREVLSHLAASCVGESALRASSISARKAPCGPVVLRLRTAFFTYERCKSKNTQTWERQITASILSPLKKSVGRSSILSC